MKSMVFSILKRLPKPMTMKELLFYKHWDVMFCVLQTEKLTISFTEFVLRLKKQ